MIKRNSLHSNRTVYAWLADNKPVPKAIVKLEFY